MFGKPRLLQLGEVAAHAEALKWKRQIRSYVTRAAFGTTAAIFGVLLLLAIHVAIWFALSGYLSELGAAFAVVGLDLAIVLILGWLAIRAVNDPLAEEAQRIRNTALVGAENEIRTLGGLFDLSRLGTNASSRQRAKQFSG